MSPNASNANLLKQAWDRFNTDLGWARASHVAMSMMLALFPFCIFVLSLAVQMSASLDHGEIVEFVFGAWPDAIAEPIEREVLAVLDQSSARTAFIGAVLALLFASNGVDAVRVAITQAYHDTDPRPWWMQRLLALVLVLIYAGLLCAAGVLVVGVPFYFDFVSDAAPGLYARVFSTEAMQAGITLAFQVFAVYTAHAWLPATRRPIRQILPGIVLTILLWFVAGALFAAYIRSFESYSVTYAGLAGVMAALVFMYLMSAILVFCAEINGAIMRRAEGLGGA